MRVIDGSDVREVPQHPGIWVPRHGQWVYSDRSIAIVSRPGRPPKGAPRTNYLPIYWDGKRRRPDKARARVTIPGGTPAFVARLVAMAWHAETYGQDLQVNHIDGNPMNNHADNLEWVTARENYDHALKLDLWRPDGMNGRSKLTDQQVQELRYRRSQGWTYKELATYFGVHYQTVYNIVRCGRRSRAGTYMGS